MQKLVALFLVVAGLAGGLVLGTTLRPAPAPDAAPDADAGDAHGQGPTQGAAAGDVPGEAGAVSAAPGGHGATAAAAGHGAEAVEGVHASAHAGDEDHGGADADREFVPIGRQMVVPVVEGGRTRALMLVELALDVPRSKTEIVYRLEPRLRDAFLRVLFEMSYTGAFLDTYTDERIVSELREKLRAAARRHLGDIVADVLILDIVRQEVS